jgi:AcrR family transcriptional regulator
MNRKRTVSSRHTYHHGDLKNALKAAAASLLALQGPQELSLREAAQAAGVSHAAAYRHYADKQALLADLAEDGFRELVAVNSRIMASRRGGALGRLEACGRAYVDFGVRRPHLLQLMFGGVITDWERHDGLSDAARQLAQTLAEIVRDGQARGEIRPGPAGDLTLAAWAQVHGLALLIAGRRIPGVTVDEAFVKRAARRCTKLLIEGLRRPRT